VRTDVDGDEYESMMQGLSDRNYGYYDLPDKIKQGEDTDRLFEGESGWTTDAFGARFPPRV
jgi:hypothetical protein